MNVRCTTRILVAVTVFGLAIGASIAEFKTISRTITLPANGSEIQVTLRAFSDMLVHEIWADNTPTDRAGLCNNTGGLPVTCAESDFEIVSVRIGGSDYRPGSWPFSIAANDKLAIRLLLDQDLSVDTAWPIPRNTAVVFVLRTTNGVNDVKIDFTVGLTGGTGVSLSVAPL